MVCISSVNKLKIICPFSPFSLLSPSFYFVLFFKFMSKTCFLNLLDTKLNSKCSLFSERERVCVCRRSPVMKGVVGWCDGAG